MEKPRLPRLLVGAMCAALVSCAEPYPPMPEMPLPPVVAEAPVPAPPVVVIDHPVVVVEPEPAKRQLDRFQIVIRLTLISEGGATYTNHPNDPGGPTKYGITIHDVRKYMKRDATAEDVKALTEEQAINIFYKPHYWDAIEADLMPVGVDYSVFDYGVNCGVSRALRVHREAVRRHPSDPIQQILYINGERMAFQMGLGPKYNVFKRGWRNRINSVQIAALKMARPVDKALASHDMPHIPRIGRGKAPSFME